jgi:hypothetical protein
MQPQPSIFVPAGAKHKEAHLVRTRVHNEFRAGCAIVGIKRRNPETGSICDRDRFAETNQCPSRFS